MNDAAQTAPDQTTPNQTAVDPRLLEILVEPPFREQARVLVDVVGKQRHLRKFSSVRHANDRARGALDKRRRAARKHVVAPQSLVRTKQRADVVGHRARGRGLRSKHVAIELRRSPHGRAGVAEDEVEALARLEQVAAERLDARGVP